MLVFAGVPREGGVKTTVGLSTMLIFSVFGGYLFVNFGQDIWDIYMYTGYMAPQRLFSDPQMRDLELP